MGFVYHILHVTLQMPLFLLYYCLQDSPVLTLAFSCFIHSANICQVLQEGSLKNCSCLLTSPPTVALNLPNWFPHWSLRLTLPKALRTKIICLCWPQALHGLLSTYISSIIQNHTFPHSLYFSHNHVLSNPHTWQVCSCPLVFALPERPSHHLF